MVVILISWLYVFFTSISFGIAVYKVLRVSPKDVTLISIIGFFSITLLAGFWAVFGPINGFFQCVVVLLSFLLYWKNKTTYSSLLWDSLKEWRELAPKIKFLFLGIALLILAQSASEPFILDNESYYIQTISWLNQYGLVKGLANLHIFLGQTSGWHITQSVYSFSFLYDRLNDLNGYLLILSQFYFFKQLNRYQTSKSVFDLTIGLLPLANIFFFQFISSPSPDLPIYIISFILFSLYWEEENELYRLGTICILCLYAILIKITAIVLLVIPILMVFQHHQIVKKKYITLGCIAILTGVLFIIKNTILTGYPFYPLTSFRLNLYTWTLPREIMDYFFSSASRNNFYVSRVDFNSLNTLELIKIYFFHSGLTSAIAWLTLLTFCITPFYLISKNGSRKAIHLFGISTLSLCMIAASSPQFRFYIHFTIFFICLIVAQYIKKWRYLLHSINGFILCFIVFIPLSYTGISSNTFNSKSSVFQMKNTLLPHANSKWETKYNVVQSGNLRFYSPTQNSFFWVTGNGTLPCVNREQIEYFQKYFHYQTQLRGLSLKEGFYAKPLNP